jgi:hypothetical protein
MKTKIDLIKEIAFALEMNGIDHYLDKDNLELISLPKDELEDDEYSSKDRMKIETNKENYIQIEAFDSSDNFNLMKEFSLTIKNNKVKENLLNALSRNKPFANFKETLHSYPDYLEEWYKYKDESYLQAASDLLNKLSISI